MTCVFMFCDIYIYVYVYILDIHINTYMYIHHESCGSAHTSKELVVFNLQIVFSAPRNSCDAMTRTNDADNACAVQLYFTSVFRAAPTRVRRPTLDCLYA